MRQKSEDEKQTIVFLCFGRNCGVFYSIAVEKKMSNFFQAVCNTSRYI